MTKREELAILYERLQELSESLERSGKKRNGTTWQTDRPRAARSGDEETRVEPGFFSTVKIPFYRFLSLFVASDCCMLKIS